MSLEKLWFQPYPKHKSIYILILDMIDHGINTYITQTKRQTNIEGQYPSSKDYAAVRNECSPGFKAAISMADDTYKRNKPWL